MKKILIALLISTACTGVAVAHDCDCNSFSDHAVVVVDDLPQAQKEARRLLLGIDLQRGNFAKADEFAERSPEHHRLLIQQIHDLVALDRLTPSEAEALITHFVQTPVLKMVRNEPQTHRFGNVYSNDDLLELTRINLASPDFAWASFRGEHADQVDMKPHFRRGTEIHTSEHWMKAGLPGVGPDGKPVQLCRLIRDRQASYYELSYSEAHAVLHDVEWPASFDEACLPAAATSEYWQQRVRGLVDERS